MSTTHNLPVEKLLLKLRRHLQRITTGKSGNVVRKLVVDGRHIRAYTTKSGMVEIHVTINTVSLYAYWNGRDRLVFNGTDSSTVFTRKVDDAQILYLLKDAIKRAFPGYNKDPLPYIKPSTRKGRHRAIFGEEFPY